MRYKYGNYGTKQLQAFRKKLHSKIHWLLIYKDPKSERDFGYVDFPSYVDSLLRELDAFNSLLLQQSEQLIEIDCLIKQAESLVIQEPFDFKTYRKCILGAHGLLDQMKFEDSADDNA